MLNEMLSFDDTGVYEPTSKGVRTIRDNSAIYQTMNERFWFFFFSILNNIH